MKIRKKNDLNRCSECHVRPEMHKLNGYYFVRCGGIFCANGFVQARTEEVARSKWNNKHPAGRWPK